MHAEPLTFNLDLVDLGEGQTFDVCRLMQYTLPLTAFFLCCGRMGSLWPKVFPLQLCLQYRESGQNKEMQKSGCNSTSSKSHHRASLWGGDIRFLDFLFASGRREMYPLKSPWNVLLFLTSSIPTLLLLTTSTTSLSLLYSTSTPSFLLIASTPTLFPASTPTILLTPCSPILLLHLLSSISSCCLLAL